MDATTTTPAVTAEHLTAVLADPETSCVWLPAVGVVDVAGLTDRHRAERHVRVLFAFDEAVDFLLAAAGDAQAAAVLASAVVGRQCAAGLL
jgi:hypothetical protein